MIPDKEGYWWYQENRIGEIVPISDRGPKIAKVYRYTGNALAVEIGDKRCPVHCSQEFMNIFWLGPVNPEPMKASGE